MTVTTERLQPVIIHNDSCNKCELCYLFILDEGIVQISAEMLVNFSFIAGLLMALLF